MPGYVVPAIIGSMTPSDFSADIPGDFASSAYTPGYAGCGAVDPRRSLLFRRMLSQHSASLTPEGSSGLHFQNLHPFCGLRPIVTDSASPCPVSRLNLRRCRIHFMLRTAALRVLLELISSLRHIQSPDASEDSYPTLWRLSGLDFHQLANDSLQNGPQ